MIFNVGAGNGGSVVYLTQAEYDALPDSKLTNNIEYRITDGDMGVATASNLSYDNSFSGLEAVTVQQAVDEVNESLNEYVKVEIVNIDFNMPAVGKDVAVILPESYHTNGEYKILSIISAISNTSGVTTLGVDIANGNYRMFFYNLSNSQFSSGTKRTASATILYAK